MLVSATLALAVAHYNFASRGGSGFARLLLLASAVLTSTSPLALACQPKRAQQRLDLGKSLDRGKHVACTVLCSSSTALAAAIASAACGLLALARGCTLASTFAIRILAATLVFCSLLSVATPLPRGRPSARHLAFGWKEVQLQFQQLISGIDGGPPLKPVEQGDGVQDAEEAGPAASKHPPGVAPWGVLHRDEVSVSEHKGVHLGVRQLEPRGASALP